MQRIETLDGYYVYSIEKEKKHCYLADKKNYKKDIQILLNAVEDIKFDSVIIIFGIDTGEYLNELYNVLCKRNRVIIFEPNEEIFSRNKDKIDKENTRLVLYDRNSIKGILYNVVNKSNFNNLYVHAFGNYAEIYKEEYKTFIENLDNAYWSANVAIGIANRFKEIYVKNLIGNLKTLKDATPLNLYEDKNKNIPAIIVSAGPSLDQNLAEMVKHKNEVEKFFIIAGNRTLKTLMENGIKPDMVVSVDPIDFTYDMMKNYLQEDVPLVFNEYSNRYLVRDCKGEKIYFSGVLSKIIKELNSVRSVYSGGSVAHTCIDIANIMGCSPIILVGQDLAYTNDKHHSDSATFDGDKKNNFEVNMDVENVFGEKIKTTVTLDFFRVKLEEYISCCSQNNNLEFINASYGAEIKGAPHKELSEIFKIYKVENKKKSVIIDNTINIDAEAVTNEVLDYIEECIEKTNKGNELCKELALNVIDKSLMDFDEDDEKLQKFLYVMNVVDNFESSPKSLYFAGYLNKFLFDIKEEIFNMSAKDFDSLTSNLRHQSKCFLAYFEKMKSFLEEVKALVLETLKEFY